MIHTYTTYSFNMHWRSLQNKTIVLANNDYNSAFSYMSSLLIIEASLVIEYM